jgi:hypothetical protein
VLYLFGRFDKIRYLRGAFFDLVVGGIRILHEQFYLLFNIFNFGGGRSYLSGLSVDLFNLVLNINRNPALISSHFGDTRYVGDYDRSCDTRESNYAKPFPIYGFFLQQKNSDYQPINNNQAPDQLPHKADSPFDAIALAIIWIATLLFIWAVIRE